MSTLGKRSVLLAMKERVKKLTPETKARWGKMNAGQMIVHVSDQIKCAKYDLVVLDQSNWFTRTIAKDLVLMGLPAPRGMVSTLEEFDPLRKGTKPKDFEKDKQALLDLMEWMFCAAPHYNFQRHPLFGVMTKKEWARLSYVHLKHHFAQFGI